VQTPGQFEYERATSIEGAIATLGRVGAGARVIAGGHSLLPMMKLRLASPEFLVDINDLHELDYIREEGAELAIGALTRHVELLENERLAT
jgi:carbon-monoxide dehydrogenase medium subunit